MCSLLLLSFLFHIFALDMILFDRNQYLKTYMDSMKTLF